MPLCLSEQRAALCDDGKNGIVVPVKKVSDRYKNPDEDTSRECPVVSPDAKHSQALLSLHGGGLAPREHQEGPIFGRNFSTEHLVLCLLPYASRVGFLASVPVLVPSLKEIMATRLQDAHIPELRLLDSACGKAKLSRAEQNHVDCCEECQELLRMFKRLGMTKHPGGVKWKTAS